MDLPDIIAQSQLEEMPMKKRSIEELANAPNREEPANALDRETLSLSLLASSTPEKPFLEADASEALTRLWPCGVSLKYTALRKRLVQAAQDCLDAYIRHNSCQALRAAEEFLLLLKVGAEH